MNTTKSKYFSSTITDAIEQLPKFDGNSCMLYKFITSADEILKAIGHTDQLTNNDFLLRSVRSKVVGQANAMLCAKCTPLNWCDIKSNLILHYADKRCANTLIKDLHDLFQGTKTFEEFYSEVVEFQQALYSLLLQESQANIINFKKALYGSMCLNVFITGLRDPLGAAVRAVQPECLDDALECCHTEAHKLKTEPESAGTISPWTKAALESHRQQRIFIKSQKFANELDYNLMCFSDAHEHMAVCLHLAPIVQRPLKFLVATGSPSSYISPDVIDEKYHLNSINSNIKHAILPIFSDFNIKGTFKFRIFKLLVDYDGLLGCDFISRLGSATFSRDFLQTARAKLKFIKHECRTFYRIPLPPNSRMFVYMAVTVKNGDILVEETKFNKYVATTEGLYTAKDWFAHIEVVNSSDKSQIISLTEPLEAEAYNSEETTVYPIHFEHLNVEERRLCFPLLKKYTNLLHVDGKLPAYNGPIKHSIQTMNNVPIQNATNRYVQADKNEILKQVAEMLEVGTIRRSSSAWNAPVLLYKPNSIQEQDQKGKLSIDYHKLNNITVADKYPLPKINDILDKLGGSMYFTRLVLANGYNQIEICPKDIPKTAFSIDNARYEFVRMPFGLKNGTSNLQKVMDKVLRELIGHSCYVYVDDIIIFSASLKKHMADLEAVFKKLNNANIKIHTQKLEFLKKELKFLGHVVTTNGIKPDPRKIEAIKAFPMPKTQKEIRSFLGLLEFQRKFIDNFSKHTITLLNCLKKDHNVLITNEYKKCFEFCRNIISKHTILQYPDFSQPFILTTEASQFALGASLSQGHIGRHKPVYFASKTLSEYEIKYSELEKEVLATVWAMKYFQVYLLGTKFQIITDQISLNWLKNLNEPNSRQQQWLLDLQTFDYKVLSKRGK